MRPAEPYFLVRQRVRITASGEAREIKPVMVGRKFTIHAFSSTSTARRDWGRRDRGKFLPARSLARLTTKNTKHHEGARRVLTSHTTKRRGPSRRRMAWKFIGGPTGVWLVPRYVRLCASCIGSSAT